MSALEPGMVHEEMLMVEEKPAELEKYETLNDYPLVVQKALLLL